MPGGFWKIFEQNFFQFSSITSDIDISMRQLILFVLAFLVISVATGQDRMESKSLIRISVVDSLTLSPIADVHVSTASGGEISDEEGGASMRLSDGDIIAFTHVNYHARQFVYNKTMGMKLVIALNPNVRVLREIRVTDVQSEEAMKRKILETEATLSKDKAVAAENSRTINTLGKIAPAPVPTREEQFFESLQGPKDVTILSSRGGGLIRVIKNITNPERLQERRPTSNYQSDPAKITPFKVKLIPRDSLKKDSTIVKEQVINSPE